MRNIHSLYDYFTTVFDKFQYKNKNYDKIIIIIIVLNERGYIL